VSLRDADGDLPASAQHEPAPASVSCASVSPGCDHGSGGVCFEWDDGNGLFYCGRNAVRPGVYFERYGESVWSRSVRRSATTRNVLDVGSTALPPPPDTLGQGI
jgi:hypothetical protein